MFRGRVNQLFFSFTGTLEISSSVGSDASQAQPRFFRKVSNSPSCSAGAQPSKNRMVPSVSRRSAPESLETSAFSRSTYIRSSSRLPAFWVMDDAASACAARLPASSFSSASTFSAAVPVTPWNTVALKL